MGIIYIIHWPSNSLICAFKSSAELVIRTNRVSISLYVADNRERTFKVFLEAVEKYYGQQKEEDNGGKNEVGHENSNCHDISLLRHTQILLSYMRSIIVNSSCLVLQKMRGWHTLKLLMNICMHIFN